MCFSFISKVTTCFNRMGLFNPTSSWMGSCCNPCIGYTMFCLMYTWHTPASVGSVTLACRSYSSTSPPGLIFTQTHSWAQSCPAHCPTVLSCNIPSFSAYGLVAILHNGIKRTKKCQIRLLGTCGMQPEQQAVLLFSTISSLFGHSKSFPAIQRNVQSLKYISVHV